MAMWTGNDLVFPFIPLLLLCFQPLHAALEAQPAMTAYRPATLRTPPFLLFLLQKRLYSLLLNKIEIFYHAHVVVRTVALIQVLQSPARVLRALVAVLCESVP